MWTQKSGIGILKSLFITDKTQNELLREEYPLREGRINKLWYVHKMEYYIATRKEWANAGHLNMTLTKITLSEKHQS